MKTLDEYVNERHKQLKARQGRAFIKLLDSLEGVDVLSRLFDFCGVLNEDIHSDPLRMARREGKRAAALFVLNELEEAQPGASIRALAAVAALNRKDIESLKQIQENYNAESEEIS